MQLTILGSGTSTGVPLIGCSCKVCRSLNSKNKRLRASAWIQSPKSSLLIDTSTDLRQQALKHKITRIDAVLYTHPHADHLYGIDELRSFNFLQKEVIPVYGNDWTTRELQGRFQYIFSPPERVQGGGIPRLELRHIKSNDQTIGFKDLKIEILRVKHGSEEVLGYRIGSIAYITDCSYIPPETVHRLKGLSVLVLDCIRLAPHDTHFNLDQALHAIDQIKARKTYLTHLGHDFDYAIWSRKLPRGVSLAYDGLKIR